MKSNIQEQTDYLTGHITNIDFTGGKTMWKHGEYNGFSWCIKAFDEGSRFGINNGKISKLWIQRKQNKEEVANYDRGWDIKPFDGDGNFYSEDVKNVYEYLIEKYN